MDFRRIGMDARSQALDAQERQRLISDMVRAFSGEEVRPQAAGLDESESFPMDLYRRMARQGLFGITVPEALGGVGADVLSYAIVMEELGRGYASVADQ